ncbi:MAG TPA: ThuA domain-containing protein [Verrucomicrobiae bacterium]|jgi:hypothetical protein
MSLRKFAFGIPALVCCLLCSTPASRAADTVTYEAAPGPGGGKHVVFLTGDEEYRSEEGLPMLAKILAKRHGFNCTVLFSINPAGSIDPDCQTNEPGLEALDSADLCVMLLRFREWPDDKMKHFVDYLNAGKPIIGLRTATHSFSYQRNKTSPYAKYDWNSTAWLGGFGRQVLGDTWVSHHGEHGKESTRGIINDAAKDNPILRGVSDLWWPTDVYTVSHLPSDATVLVWGQVLSGMSHDDPPVEGEKNNPLQPLVWARNYTSESGKVSRIVATTAGSAVDLKNEGLRRLFVNACYWTMNMEDKAPAMANVDYVGDYNPTYFGFKGGKKGVKPDDLKFDTSH